MTIGQRIAQKRKELNLSQEALGEQLGVSRQAIYKWEADSALPEIDKLIALSRLFGVSVGWLLGVEELPQAEPQNVPEADGSESVPEENEGELTEAQLKMVETIVERYTAALPRPHRRRWPFVLAGMVLIIVFMNLFQALDMLRLQQESIFNDLSRVESSVDGQINSISNRVQEILKAQNSLAADYGVEIVSADLGENRVSFSAYAVPKTYVEGMQAEFFVENGTGPVEYFPGEPTESGGFSASLTCALTDNISVSVVLITPDGTRSTQLLSQFDRLYSSSLPGADVMNYALGFLLDLEADEQGTLTLPEVYATAEPDLTEDAGPVGQGEIASIRMGLFVDRTLLEWLEPCDQPESFHGDYEGMSFFHLPEGVQVTLRGEEELTFAAVVTDQYGREGVFSDIPYFLRNRYLTWVDAADLSDHSPENWSY